MLENYEMIFAEVMEQRGYTEWYKLFDSEDFEIVEQRCQALDNFDLDLYTHWVNEMAWDL